MTRQRRMSGHLPAKMYFKHGRHWYVDAGKWRPLAKDIGPALKEYPDIVQAPRGGCAELIDAPLEAKKRRQPPLAPSTLEQYAIAAARLKAILLEFAPDQGKPKHVAAVKLFLPRTPNMANRIMSFGRQAFDFGLEAQLVEINPFVC